MADNDFPRGEPQDIEGDLRFQVVDWFVPEADKAERELRKQKKVAVDWDAPLREYDIHMFGSTEAGQSVSVKVTGFEPYFYVKVEGWQKPGVDMDMKLARLREKLVDPYDLGINSVVRDPKRKRQLVSITLVKRKDFWGFNNGKRFPFIMVRTKSLALFQQLRKYFQDHASEGYQMYESNIDPFIRMIHERNLAPCGWVKIPAGCYQADDPDASRAQIAVVAAAADIEPVDMAKIAPLLIASFDIECSSSHGDFPVPIKDYRKLALDLLAVYRSKSFNDADGATNAVVQWIMAAFKRKWDAGPIHIVYPKKPVDLMTIAPKIGSMSADVVEILDKYKRLTCDDADDGASDAPDEEDEDEDEDYKKQPKGQVRKALERSLTELLSKHLPPLKGDQVIQIGTTVHRYGSDDIIYKHIVTLGTCDPIPGADVQAVSSEAALLKAWRSTIQSLDPDIITGYNIFGFDMKYIWSRVQELGIEDEFAVGLGRLKQRRTTLLEQKLSSSALGDNFLYYIDMDGCVSVDVMKVMQRDHKLDSFKLDNVAKCFLGDQKNDLKPQELFEKFLGTAADRCEIARYCIQDCALCNRLMHKLKVLENNIGMGNVCSVPLSYLFMRGQGVKIFSLVAKECREAGMLIPVINNYDTDKAVEESYEGAIVLEPTEGIYLDDPIVVFDFSSLYPSSMIARNLSHDSFVMDKRYMEAAAPGVTFLTVKYDINEGVGDKKHVVGSRECTFAQFPDGKKGIMPTILMKLLKMRKQTRKRMEYETVKVASGSFSGIVTDNSADGALTVTVTDVQTGLTTSVQAADVVSRAPTFNEFELAVLDALQNAFKITANSLYGQLGSPFSPVSCKDIAASVTATGREMIYTAKQFMEVTYGAEVIYGDTDSIFCKFPCDGKKGREALPVAIAAGQRAAAAILEHLPPPQVLNYEKTMWPLILLSKKRYVGHLYESDPNKLPKEKSMGIVLKRRDNAPIVKRVYRGIINILLTTGDFQAAVRFLLESLEDLAAGRVPLDELILSKTLSANYKDPLRIAHKVLAERIGERDPGNKPAVNERIPFIYFQPPAGQVVKLQGERIEHPDFIREKNLTPDYRFYITNQLMKPIRQLFGLCVQALPNYTLGDGYWVQMEDELYESGLTDKAVKDRILVLKAKVAEDLLFAPILERMGGGVKVAIKRTPTAKRKAVQPTSALEANAVTLTVSALYDRKAKLYTATAAIAHDDSTHTIEVINKKKLLSEITVMERAMTWIWTAELLARGVRCGSTDKAFLAAFKRGMANDSTAGNAASAAAVQFCDIEAVQAELDANQFTRLNQMFGSVKWCLM